MNASRVAPVLRRVFATETRWLSPRTGFPFFESRRPFRSDLQQSVGESRRGVTSSGSSAGTPDSASRPRAGPHLHSESEDPTVLQPKRRTDLKVGPYTRGRFFVSPREDPKEFILCLIVLGIFAYTLLITFSQPGGETVNQRRRRIIRERLMREAGLTQADLDELEDGKEAPLSG